MQLELQGRRVYAYTGTKPIVQKQRTVMFIHGAANDHSVWALQSRYFAYHGCNVLAIAFYSSTLRVRLIRPR